MSHGFAAFVLAQPRPPKWIGATAKLNGDWRKDRNLRKAARKVLGCRGAIVPSPVVRYAPRGAESRGGPMSAP